MKIPVWSLICFEQKLALSITNRTNLSVFSFQSRIQHVKNHTNNPLMKQLSLRYGVKQLEEHKKPGSTVTAGLGKADGRWKDIVVRSCYQLSE